jgi:hypothetical protein
MDREIIYLLIGAGLSVFGGAISELIRHITDNSLSKKSLQREYVYKIYENRIVAYQKLYTELVSYNKLFADYYILVTVEEVTTFDIRGEYDNLEAFFKEHEVYYSDELIKIMKIMLYNNFIKLAELPAYIEPNNVLNNQLINECSKETMDCIAECFKIIKKELKIEEINKDFK